MALAGEGTRGARDQRTEACDHRRGEDRDDTLRGPSCQRRADRLSPWCRGISDGGGLKRTGANWSKPKSDGN